MSRFTKRPRLLVVLIALLGAMLLAESVALAATMTRTGKGITALKTVSSDSLVSTTSNSFVDVPGMSLSLGVPDGTSALFMIQFSANRQCQPAGATNCQIRALVDGTPVSSSVMYERAQSAWQALTNHWVAGPFTAGSHVIKIQYSAEFNPETFYLSNTTLTVLRSKV